MKYRVFLASVFFLGISASGFAQGQFSANIAGGPHDLSNGSAVRNGNTTINGQTCVFCHVPHGGATSLPLWNRATPTTTYTTYASSTMKTATTSGAIQGSISGSCLSCHDGTIALDVLTNVNGVTFGTLPKGGSVTFARQAGTAKATYANGTSGTGNVMAGGLPFMGTDLQNDHPVSVVYNTALAADSTHYAAIAGSGTRYYINGAAGQLPLYGATSASATVECASCHDAHNNSLNGTSGGFLRQANTGSQMCKACHLK